VHKSSNGLPDTDRTPRIWLAIDGVFKAHARKAQDAVSDESQDKLNRMAIFKSKSANFVTGHSSSSAAVHQHHRPVAGTSLFLAPGALSGLMRPLEAGAAAAAGHKRSLLKAEWVREGRRPPSAQHKRQSLKSGRQKTARFAQADQLESIRQTAVLSPEIDEALEAGWGERSAVPSERAVTPKDIQGLQKRIELGAESARIVTASQRDRGSSKAFSSLYQADVGEAPPSSRVAGELTKPGGRPFSAARGRPGSARPLSGKSRPETRGIIKQASVRQIRLDKYVKSQKSKRHLLEASLEREASFDSLNGE
jgi:hypothetical protein